MDIHMPLKKRFKYVEISLTPNQSIEDTINIMFDDFHIHKGSSILVIL